MDHRMLLIQYYSCVRTQQAFFPIPSLMISRDNWMADTIEIFPIDLIDCFFQFHTHAQTIYWILPSRMACVFFRILHEFLSCDRCEWSRFSLLCDHDSRARYHSHYYRRLTVCVAAVLECKCTGASVVIGGVPWWRDSCRHFLDREVLWKGETNNIPWASRVA